MKKLLSVILLLTLAVGLGSASAQADEFIPQGFAPSSDRQGVTIEDLPEGPEWISIITKPMLISDDFPETAEDPQFCKSLITDGCKIDGSRTLNVVSILPACDSGQQNNCVEGLKLTKPDGSEVIAQFLKASPGFRFDGIPSLDAPGGETPSIWVAEGAENAAGSAKYVVNVAIGWRLERGVVRIGNMSARVLPVKDTFGTSFLPSRIMYHTNPFTQKFQSNHDNGEQGGLDKCAATDVGYCAEKVDFVPGMKAELSLRITNKVTGWLHGRLSEPSISVTKIDGKHNKMTISGSAVQVPMMYAEFEKSKMTSEFLQHFKFNYSLGGINGKSTWYRFNSAADKSRAVITTLASAANDTAKGVKSYWSVKSISADNSNNACLVDDSRLVGLVTTNAMAYSGAAPKWDGATLRYEVAGLHYLTDGKTLAEGTYDLAIRSDVARCMYGFSSAPVSAEISVVSESGESKVATTVVRENGGWLTLRAAGFTFSSPTISIKLTQQPIKKKTITCIRGKVVKKVTASAPKCPAGYKKK